MDEKKRFAVKDDHLVFISSTDKYKFIQFGDFIAPEQGAFSNILTTNNNVFSDPKEFHSYSNIKTEFGFELPFVFMIFYDKNLNKYKIIEQFNIKEIETFKIISVKHNIFSNILDNSFDPPQTTYTNDIYVSKNDLKSELYKIDYIRIVLQFGRIEHNYFHKFTIELLYPKTLYFDYIKGTEDLQLNRTFFGILQSAIIYRIIKADEIENNDITMNLTEPLKYEYVYNLDKKFPDFTFTYYFNHDTNKYVVNESFTGHGFKLIQINHDILSDYLDYTGNDYSLTREVEIDKNNFENAIAGKLYITITLKCIYGFNHVYNKFKYIFPLHNYYFDTIKSTESISRKFTLYLREIEYYWHIFKRIFDSIDNSSIPSNVVESKHYQLYSMFTLPTK